MVTSRQQAAEQRRRHLLGVAVEVFARYGFAATTTKLIAREAGVAEGLLFHYFPTKLDLLREIVSDYGGYRLAATEILSRLDPGDVRAGLAEFARALLAHLREHADLIAVLAGEGQIDSELSGVFWEVVGGIRGQLAAWLGEAVAAGSLDPAASTETAAAMITATLSFFFLEHRRLPEEEWAGRAGAITDALVATVLGGIAGRESP